MTLQQFRRILLKYYRECKYAPMKSKTKLWIDLEYEKLDTAEAKILKWDEKINIHLETALSNVKDGKIIPDGTIYYEFSLNKMQEATSGTIIIPEEISLNIFDLVGDLNDSSAGNLTSENFLVDISAKADKLFASDIGKLEIDVTIVSASFDADELKKSDVNNIEETIIKWYVTSTTGDLYNTLVNPLENTIYLKNIAIQTPLSINNKILELTTPLFINNIVTYANLEPINPANLDSNIVVNNILLNASLQDLYSLNFSSDITAKLIIDAHGLKASKEVYISYFDEGNHYISDVTKKLDYEYNIEDFILGIM